MVEHQPLTVAASDVAMREQTEEVLARTLRRLADAEAIGKLGGWDYDVASGLVAWTDEVYRIHGLDRSFDPSSVGCDVSFYAPESAEVIVATFGRALTQAEPYDLELELDRADGRRIWVRTIGQPYVEDGKVVRLAGTIMDIDERKRTELSLIESRSLTEATLESTDNGFLVVGPDGKVLRTNSRFAEMWRIPAEVLASGDDQTLLAHVMGQLDDPEGFAAGVAALYGKPFAESTDVLHFRDGRDFERVSRPMLVDGEPLGRVWSFRDVTRYKQVEAALLSLNDTLEERVEARTRELSQAIQDLTEANEAKTRFLRSMSHELRTPLNSVIGFSSVMMSGMTGGVNEEQQRQLAMINASGKHLLALINDILDLSRIEAGRVEVRPERIDVTRLMEEVIASVAPDAEAKGLGLKLLVTDPAPTLSSDPTKVSQILLNLVENAIKFTDSGSVTLHVHRRSPLLVAFSVSDTGPGIAPDERERIFGEFERAADQGPAVEGTGLGLAISRGLAASLGGILELETSVGKGSTFTLTLPATPAVD
jgi:PAS domain S-box-containing protein